MNQDKRQKRRWNWKSKHLRKNRFSFKGIRYKGRWYFDRTPYHWEDHKSRRTYERLSLKQIQFGEEETNVYFPTKWRRMDNYYD